MDKESQREHCLRMLSEVSSYAEELGMEIALGVGRYPDSVCMTTLAEMRKVDEELPDMKFMLDIHTAYLAGDTVREWIHAIGDRIVHVRFTDGRYTGASICGQGDYPMRKAMEELIRYGYSGTAALHIQSEIYAREPEKADYFHRLWLEEVCH